MIRLTNPTGRNTRAHIVTISIPGRIERGFFFSYETCIAYCGPDGNGGFAMIRIPNRWGPTTGRHFRELGCDNFHEIPEDEFNLVVSASVE